MNNIRVLQKNKPIICDGCSFANDKGFNFIECYLTKKLNHKDKILASCPIEEMNNFYEWVRTSDRMPETNRPVFVMKDGEVFQYQVYWNGSEWRRVKSNHKVQGNITAWFDFDIPGAK